MKLRSYLIILIVLFFSCSEDDNDMIQEELVLAGGETTIFSSGPDAYTFPSANLDQSGLDRHFLADGAFGQQFVSAPSPQFGGLGPLFNQNSCESCHLRNGRGNVPQYDGDTNSGLLLRLSIDGTSSNGGILPVPGFGGQLQTKASFGITKEGSISKTEVKEIVSYLSGEQIELTHPTYYITDPYLPLPMDVRISPRNAPAVYGLGLLDAIPESDLLAHADEDDLNGDGISGRPNLVWDVLKGELAIGRFGWKAEQPTAGQQAGDAAHNDMGLTNFYFTNEHCENQENCLEGLQASLDIDTETMDLMTFYFQTLAVPIQRNQDNVQVQRGEDLFFKANCNSCHQPTYTTGEYEVSELSYQLIHPYTDLLLHDMGPGLADNRPTFMANGREWRTAPLWGIGLAKVVNDKATFLHDGRAETIEEAIMWHGGEAEQSKEIFRSFTAAERSDLLTFINSL